MRSLDGIPALQILNALRAIPRRCAEGQGISVNDTDVIETTNHLLPAATAQEAAAMHRLQATLLSTPLVPLLRPTRECTPTSPRDLSKKSLKSPLPRALHLLSLDRLQDELTTGLPANRARCTPLLIDHACQTTHSTLNARPVRAA